MRGLDRREPAVDAAVQRVVADALVVRPVRLPRRREAVHREAGVAAPPVAAAVGHVLVGVEVVPAGGEVRPVRERIGAQPVAHLGGRQPGEAAAGQADVAIVVTLVMAGLPSRGGGAGEDRRQRRLDVGVGRGVGRHADPHRLAPLPARAAAPADAGGLHRVDDARGAPVVAEGDQHLVERRPRSAPRGRPRPVRGPCGPRGGSSARRDRRGRRGRGRPAPPRRRRRGRDASRRASSASDRGRPRAAGRRRSSPSRRAAPPRRGPSRCRSRRAR